MRPKKPLNQFTLEALLRCQESFKGLIVHTEELINCLRNLNPDHTLRSRADEIAVAKAMKEGMTLSGFIELAEINLKDFNENYDLVLEELHKRQQ